jgi:hypothetical protein
LCKAQTQLNANAASIHSNGGNGTLGHLVLMMAPAAYLALSRVPFIPPVNPPLVPLHTAGVTAAQITKTNRLHRENQVTFRTFHNVDNALCNLLITAVHPSYIHCLQNNVLGFGNVTCQALLALL